MKKIILYILFLCALTASAQEQCLVVWQRNGQKVFYDLEEEPHTTFAPGRLIITTSALRAEYALSDVLRYTYEGITTAIDNSEIGGMGFSQRGDEIAIHGTAQGTAAMLYDLYGHLLDSTISDGHTPLHFSLAGRPTGTYIVKLGDQSLKFTKQ